jgi:hypothetical protein
MGQTITLWHGSNRPLDRFEQSRGPDGAVHLGSRIQAGMRNSAFLHEVEVEIQRVRRCRDRGGDWGERVRQARAEGFDAIVYLNRYEGVSAATIERLALSGRLAGLDALPDPAFRRLVPEAEDSYILLHPERVRVLRIIPKGGPADERIDPDRNLPTP